jgi:glucose/mannose-6-phosphate isomerase
LIDLTSLQKYDSKKMYEVYDNWPQIAKKSFDADLELIEKSNVTHIVFAGMGGSGSIGSIFSSILSKSNIHVSVVKGYELPKTVNEKTLVVITSISGNTSETTAVLRTAKSLNCKIIAFASGGKIESYCIENKIDFRKISLMHSPRASFTGFLYSMLKILQPVIPIPNEDIIESINELEKLKMQISSENLSKNNPAICLAEWISNIPLIYYPAGLQAAAIRFKNSLQENTKMHGMTEDVVEACHNGIVSWEKTSHIIPILIRGKDDHIKTKERWEIIKEFFKSKNISYKEIFSEDGSILTKLICLVYLLDYATIYRSVLSKTDPTPINPIDFVKNRL